ncbi:MAG: hypothetical protein WBF97_07610 [Comamonas sp.]
MESRDSFKAELEGLVAEFEYASEALPPDEHTLRQWTQRARGLYSRVDASGEPGRNKLLQKIKAFRMRVWIMRTDRRRYREQREELGLTSDDTWRHVPAQLAQKKRHKLSQAIEAAWPQPDLISGSGGAPSVAPLDAPSTIPSNPLAEVEGNDLPVPAGVAEREIPYSGDATTRSELRKFQRERLPVLPSQAPASRSTRLDPIIAIAGRLARAGSFDEAREITCQWLRKKHFKVAKPFQDNFELEGPIKGHHAMAVGLQGIWAMQAETADTTMEGRRWRVELVLVDAQPTPAVGVTLTAISPANQPAPGPSVPALVSQLIDGIGLLDTEAGELLSARPIQVNTPGTLQRLLRSLQSPKRHRPAIVLSTYNKGNRRATLLDPDGLAKRLRGIAKVYVLSRETIWALTDALSKRFAVSGASVRLFRPGFTPDDDPSRHPIWGPSTLNAQGLDLAGLSGLFEREAADASLRALEQEDVIPPFDRVREKVLRMQIEEARRQAASTSAGGELSAVRVGALQAALDDETKLREMYEEDNEAQRQELQRLRDERDGLRAREYHFEGRIDALEKRLRELEGTRAPTFPDTWDNLEEWCEQHLGNCVAVTAKAIRAARDSVFENVSFCYEVLLFLTEIYVPSRRGTLEGGGERLEAEKTRLGVDISPVGRAAEMHRSKETYSTTYKGTRVNLDMHVKGSNDRDPRKVFRLYFGWHEESQRVVVGWFPSHLDNAMT